MKLVKRWRRWCKGHHQWRYEGRLPPLRILRHLTTCELCGKRQVWINRQD